MRQGGTEDDKTTWTGKRVRGDGKVEQSEVGGVGKYLKAAMAEGGAGNSRAAGDGDSWQADIEEPVKKKVKSRGFGNFDDW